MAMELESRRRENLSIHIQVEPQRTSFALMSSASAFSSDALSRSDLLVLLLPVSTRF